MNWPWIAGVAAAADSVVVFLISAGWNICDKCGNTWPWNTTGHTCAWE